MSQRRSCLEVGVQLLHHSVQRRVRVLRRRCVGQALPQRQQVCVRLLRHLKGNMKQALDLRTIGLAPGKAHTMSQAQMQALTSQRELSQCALGLHRRKLCRR